MSVEEVKRLDADIKSNATLAAQFKGISDVKTLVAKANEEGYSITVDDVKAATGNTELSDDALDSAAGGGQSIAFNTVNFFF